MRHLGAEPMIRSLALAHDTPVCQHGPPGPSLVGTVICVSIFDRSGSAAAGTTHRPGPIAYGEHVAAARERGAPIVALETTIVSHGLPRPTNLSVAREIEQT